MPLTETEFDCIASDLLQHLCDVIEDDYADHAEADIEAGILKIEMDSGAQFIINKHAPNKQIWVSSPKSGALHFDYKEDDESWIGTRGGENLIETIAADLEALTGEAISFSR